MAGRWSGDRGLGRSFEFVLNKGEETQSCSQKERFARSRTACSGSVSVLF